MSARDPGAGAGDLADGFGAQMARWARQRGADAGSIAALRHAARRVAEATRDGHVCVALSALGPFDAAGDAPDAPGWRRLLQASSLVGTPDAPGACPLIIDDGDRLYLHRYFDLERRLARRLRAAADAAPSPIEPAAWEALRAGAAPPVDGDGAVDLQAVAAALALRQRLLVVSGGPGTGKTSTVVRLLAALLAQQPACRIALAAPTGKAAARMAQALVDRAGTLPAALRDRLPTRASTVHRLLGVRGDGGFQHGRERPLPIDLLVVDEASMLDLALATRLLEAVPPDARIVLLGDRDQLAAVEAGAVFAEIGTQPGLGAAAADALAVALGVPATALVAAMSGPHSHAGAAPLAAPLVDSVVWFRRNHRFAADSGIGRLAAAVRDGDSHAVRALLQPDASAELRWIDDAASALGATAWAAAVDGHAPYLDQVRRDPHDVAAAGAAFARFGLLCALQRGPRGVAGLNARLERLARAGGAPGADAGAAAAAMAGSVDPPLALALDPWYPGRPVMVLRNDPALQLFNGDVGLALPDAHGRLVVWFAGPDGGWRPVPPWRLPPHQTAFATTVHKAQGSEFDRVLVLLPARDSRIATRELLYTAVTRARREVVLVGPAAVIDDAVATPTRRDGGLAARLAEAAARHDDRPPSSDRR